MQHIEKGGSVMIDYEKLDKLMELPVSEEMLGAYIEGKLNDGELFDVYSRIESSDDLQLLVKDVLVDDVDEICELSPKKNVCDSPEDYFDDIM